ncbi:Hypothetical predicted protein [Mytilus galloprovincialis]|uniref:Uncharacterized protein n=1 Tax=Mytilus galloprovincialis TaxID=29158 RepID=A0A8B6CMF4_MYTGA|nr:Hypothetical predicted protein [Mytilus galloprovincialis]
MEVAGIPLFSFISLILTIVAFIIDIVGFATPYWYYREVAGIAIKAGLWKTCSPECVNIENQKSWQEAVQAMEVLGFICLLVALVVLILKLFVMKDKQMLKLVVMGSLVGAAIFILIGVCIYGGEAEKELKENIHFAFAFVIIAAILAIIAAVLLFMDKTAD